MSVNTLWIGILIEGGLVALAVLLGFLNFFDHQQPLAGLARIAWLPTLGWGIAGALPLTLYLLVFHYWHPAFYQPMRKLVDQKLRPMFADAGIVELIVLALMAGLGEELFFRWCLQGGATSLMEPWLGEIPALLIGLIAVSLLFGLCHWVNVIYFLFATIAGAYLGLVMWWTESWVAAAIAHALFDFVAFMYLRYSRPRADSIETELA